MEIELERHPRYQGANDEDCIWYLKIDGYVLGSYYCGKEKFYKDKNKWANKMIKQRLPVVERNIKRLEEELMGWKNEFNVLSSYKEPNPFQ